MKTVKVLVAALAIAAIATPAMAITADISGNMWLRGMMSEGLGANDVEARGMDQRLRLFTTAAANENVKMVFGIEVDNIYGRVNQTAGAAKEVGAMSADATAQIEVKHLYLDFKIPTLKANARIGTQAFAFGRGMIMNDDAAGLQFDVPVAGNNLSLTYIRTQSGDQTTSNDNGDFYGAKYSLAFGGVKVAPYLAYYNEEDGAPMPREIIYLGADVDGKLGNFGYAVTALLNDWETPTTDGNAWALYGKVTTKIDRVGLSLEAGRLGDNDRANGQFASITQGGPTGPLVNLSEISTGGRFAQTSALVANIGGPALLYSTNWMWVKVGAEMQLTEAVKGSLFIAHIEEAEDTWTNPTTRVAARTYGQEVNAYLDYAIVPNLDFTLMGAYLMADDIRNDDVYKLGTQLAYRF